MQDMALEPLLTTLILGRPSQKLIETTSTNDYIKLRADSLSNGFAVYTLNQTAGKGRRGRAWDDGGGGKALALSVLISKISASTFAMLPLCCGLAVLDAIESLSGYNCTLKWPNDVLLDGRKLSGILCEGFTLNGALTAVAGIGINLYQTNDDFTFMKLPYACSLFSVAGRQFKPDEVAAAVLNQLESVVMRCESDGFSAIKERYEDKCISIGREVRVLYDGCERIGIAKGIGSDGALIVDCVEEMLEVRSGEASIRGMLGYY